MARFIHHYTRYRAHLDSSKIEERQFPATLARLERCLHQAEAKGFFGKDEVKEKEESLTFVREAFQELAASRAMLQRSYAYAFFEMAHGMKDLKDFVEDESRLAR